MSSQGATHSPGRRWPTWLLLSWAVTGAAWIVLINWGADWFSGLTAPVLDALSACAAWANLCITLYSLRWQGALRAGLFWSFVIGVSALIGWGVLGDLMQP